jgi:RND superfamily putative drug exporter
MDYHVFLLSRIKEYYYETSDNRASVAFGLRSTAGIITGAALIMVGVFGDFDIGDMSIFQQMGFGLAAAVIIDATLVRSILVPASMVLCSVTRTGTSHPGLNGCHESTLKANQPLQTN